MFISEHFHKKKAATKHVITIIYITTYLNETNKKDITIESVSRVQ